MPSPFLPRLDHSGIGISDDRGRHKSYIAALTRTRRKAYTFLWQSRTHFLIFSKPYIARKNVRNRLCVDPCNRPSLPSCFPDDDVRPRVPLCVTMAANRLKGQ